MLAVKPRTCMITKLITNLSFIASAFTLPNMYMYLELQSKETAYALIPLPDNLGFLHILYGVHMYIPDCLRNLYIP